MVKTPAKDQRAAILGHAAKLFQTRGYHAATMDELAAAVQLNKATVYYYFESKANLLFEIILNMSDRRLAMLQDVPSELPPHEKLRRFIVDTIVLIAEHPVDSSVSFQEAPFLERWLSGDQVKVIRSRQRNFEHYAADVLRAGQQEGLFDLRFDARIVAEALAGMISLFVRWYRPDKRMSPREVGNQWGVLAVGGLLTPEGSAQLTHSLWPE